MRRSPPSAGLVPAASTYRHARPLAGRAAAFAAGLALAASAGLVPVSAHAHERDVAEAAALINTIRAKLDACGHEGMLGDAGMQRVAHKTHPGPNRPPVAFNPRLATIAAGHARAMAEQNFFDHVDPQGKTVGARATEGGYRWKVVGENLAAGQDSIGEAVRGWLLSTSHCKNLVDDRFTEFGLAKAHSTDPLDPYGVYWVLVMGKPQITDIASR